ncbi:hypothetical protein CALCODRAFT_480380 [Calocera cornea HHB12733]|uniref:Tom7-domain-containing protein n=1 Tax=Calocera cornea HHB12733 TaxID=1353952 RepID=A0A165IKW8_9BASI|nr:hypothetical protein CALCODRAFT_480380 [Calocera cornea HHB12733]
MVSEETQERIQTVVEVSKTVLYYAWIPVIIYIGYTRSNPHPSLIQLVSPLA